MYIHDDSKKFIKIVGYAKSRQCLHNTCRVSCSRQTNTVQAFLDLHFFFRHDNNWLQLFLTLEHAWQQEDCRNSVCQHDGSSLQMRMENDWFRKSWMVKCTIKTPDSLKEGEHSLHCSRLEKRINTSDEVKQEVNTLPCFSWNFVSRSGKCETLTEASKGSSAAFYLLYLVQQIEEGRKRRQKDLDFIGNRPEQDRPWYYFIYLFFQCKDQFSELLTSPKWMQMIRDKHQDSTIRWECSGQFPTFWFHLDPPGSTSCEQLCTHTRVSRKIGPVSSRANVHNVPEKKMRG